MGIKKKEELMFSFGRNWGVFLKKINDENVKEAASSITSFLGLPDLHAKSFLDIGCGSGLFSYAALKSGAKRIVSFDVDELSVACCKHLHEKAGRPERWEVARGSVLDEGFVSRIGTFDVVYAWGVLHHTGRMWDAIVNSARLVNKKGYYYIAIYNKTHGFNGSSFWLKVKQISCACPFIGKYILENMYVVLFFAVQIMKGRNPWRIIRDYRSHRGMTWRTDVADWINGYPYECASIFEIQDFMAKHFPFFIQVGIKTTKGLGCNWFLFENRGA